MYAFIDETGAFGFNFQSPDCTHYFIICAIIVKESDLPSLESAVERVRSMYFQTGEMKSSKIGKKNHRRKRILDALQELPYSIYAFICDKQKIGENSGLRYKQSFYKFLNNLVYEELKLAFPRLTIVADSIGENEFLQSFSKYMSEKNMPSDLFGESSFSIEDSKGNVLIQLADFIAGSLAFCYEPSKIPLADGYNYQSILGNKILRLSRYPSSFSTYTPPDETLDIDYNQTIATISYRQAVAFK